MARRTDQIKSGEADGEPEKLNRRDRSVLTALVIITSSRGPDIGGRGVLISANFTSDPIEFRAVLYSPDSLFSAQSHGHVLETLAQSHGHVLETLAQSHGHVLETLAQSHGHVLETLAQSHGHVLETLAQSHGHVLETLAQSHGHVLETLAQSHGHVLEG
ncbi:hypothetical protein BgiBS90_007152 [Biomphalaria glabrata]|nr:hypothetical protein BgiBS90_007152 [Biomphalaria glabrata]